MPKPSTRERIEERADTLFYERGFEATSFADIAAAVGISRGNFYHHFKTKDDILDAVITRRLAATQAMLEDWEADAAPDARIISFIRILIANRAKIMAFGCPVGTLNSELSKLDHLARGRAAGIFALFRDWLAWQFAALGHADRAGALALHVLGRSQGIAVMASTFQDEAFLRAEVAALESWLHGLVVGQTHS
ncbi:TetR/AcrR family transcriptional regulator [Pseudosulfitobacter sp. DSM 107133]|uniref:TetR/AcrR family transcriptional regulator n=1 Tax=Pseudosulfitobacter sp. DSM 107133 TaxID=2883100 RepID=UPI000DF31A01|nr:TetR/AcrR family transcriptional regulator [Pseudosulfitobacter sp. DSM 107133]UOA28629.1 HTH-type transcriptional repressor KstR2 [Pseudosulfitobacter sp. DSM 107133]